MATGLRRIALLSLVALPLLLTLGSEPAHASCTYNVAPAGQGSDYSFSFESIEDGWNSYRSNALGPQQSQCWYAHGWSGGAIGFADGNLQPDGIDVDAHGWIDICTYTGMMDLSPYLKWEYSTFSAQGVQEESAAGVDRYPPNGQTPPGCPSQASAGTSASRAAGPIERPRANRNADAALFTGRPRSPKVKSITFHVHSARGKTLGSVCLPPVDLSYLDLGLVRRMKIAHVYLGIVENPRRCHHPSVAGRERAERPRRDVRFASFCQKTRTRVLRTYRYPDDFKRRTRPNCGRQAG